MISSQPIKHYQINKQTKLSFESTVSVLTDSTNKHKSTDAVKHTITQQHVNKHTDLYNEISRIKSMVSKSTHKKLPTHIFRSPITNTSMYRFDIAVLAPHAVETQCTYLINGMPSCPDCGSTLTTKVAGFHDKIFSIYNTNRSIILIVQRYKCTNTVCIRGTRERTFCLSEINTFNKLPDLLKQDIGFFHINSFWYTREFIEYLVEHRLLMSLENIRANISKTIESEFQHRKNLYIQSFINTNQSVPFTPDTPFGVDYGEEPMPVINTLNTIYMQCVKLLKGNAIEQHFNALTAEFYMADHCFSAMSNVYYMAENKSKIQPFEALYTIMCAKTHQVVRWSFVTSTAHEQTVPLWQAVADQHKQMKQADPIGICADNCCCNRSPLVVSPTNPLLLVT